MDPLTILLTLSLGFLLLYHFLWRPMNHFKRLGVQQDRPVPIFGNMAPYLFRRLSFAEHIQKFYNRYSDAKYFGFYNFVTPVIILRDPELINTVTVKSFDQFCDHHGFVDGDLDPLMGKNLFALRGDYWREMRKLLSPAFTGSKMKIMFKLINDVAQSFSDFVANESTNGKVLDLKDVFGRYTTDVVATCSFGISTDSMRNPNNDFYVTVKEAINFTTSLSLKFAVGKNFPNLSKLLGLKIFSDKTRQFFHRIVADTVRMREEKDIRRPDMIQLMMESRGKDGLNLSIEDMTNQAFIFFLGGFDTTSSFLCFAAHEIGVNPDVQSRLLEEIEEVMRKTNGQPTYESINEMKYLDAIMNETLRLYSVAVFLDRLCVKEFQLPPATPGSKPVTIKPGQVVWYSPFSLQRDPKYYPNPEKFDPERFLKGNVSQSVYLPFGIGPRVCIGNRFALLESKMVLFHLLLRCHLEPCEKTSIPLKLCKKSFILMAEGGFWLNCRKRDRAIHMENNCKISNGSLSK